MIVGKTRWVRSADGLVAGVCEGLAKQFDIDTWIIRSIWLLAVLCLGTGVFFYFILAIGLPRQDKLSDFNQKKLFGVCYRLSRAADMELGIVRVLALLSLFASGGTAILVYAALYFVLPKAESLPAKMLTHSTEQ